MKVTMGTHISVDLATLLSTRMLIQANSGGGKSWAIRKLLEVTHGKVQQIVLDIEGDFSSLREKYDFILAGKGGDIPADPKSAELLARKVLELGSDLIVDLYELKQPERIRFVKLFLEAMINAPKSLWHPVLVILDEAHIFAPEKAKAESMGAVIDMATRGRKRGYCIVMATQRLSKLHKDAAAECNNKMIGRTGLDIDVKRAVDELGITGRDTSFMRRLSPGEFYVYGPALSKEVVLGSVGPVETRHPKAGKIGKIHSPAPSSKVKAALAKLQDLPKEAEDEVKDRSVLNARIKQLESELRLSQKNGAPMQSEKLIQMQTKLKADFERQVAKRMASQGAMMKKTICGYIDQHMLDTEYNNKVEIPVQIPIVRTKVEIKNKDNVAVGQYEADQTLGACERKILGFLTARPQDSFSKVQVGAMTGYANSSGGFNNAISRLNTMGLIHRQSGQIQITSDGLTVGQSLGDVPHTLQDWINKLGACERKIYETVLSDQESSFSKEEIAEKTGYQAGSGGFNNAISRLNTLGLIKREQGMIRLNDEIANL